MAALVWVSSMRCCQKKLIKWNIYHNNGVENGYNRGVSWEFIATLVIYEDWQPLS